MLRRTPRLLNTTTAQTLSSKKISWVTVLHLADRNVQRFRGGLAFKAHRLLYHSTLGLRVIKKKRRSAASRAASHECCDALPASCKRELFIDNLLVRIHCIIVMIRWTGLAPWEFEFPFPGSRISTFLPRTLRRTPRLLHTTSAQTLSASGNAG